jgi:hypothetical protein
VSPTRRSVLIGLGVGGVVVAGGLAGWQVLGDDDDGSTAPTTTTPRQQEPASSLSEALVAVGGRYLEEVPDEADQDALLDELTPLEGRVPEHPAQALQVLGPQAAADHESGDTVVLDGWVLSRTECRAAALYAL